MQTNYEFLMEEIKERKLNLDHFIFTDKKGKQFVMAGIDKRPPASIGLRKYNPGNERVSSDTDWVTVNYFNSGKVGYKNI